MHDIGVMFASENVSCSTHVGCKLIDFSETPIDHLAAELRVSQISDDKIISFRLRKLIEYEINAADPEAVAL
jgi:hypothetical protein